MQPRADDGVVVSVQTIRLCHALWKEKNGKNCYKKPAAYWISTLESNQLVFFYISSENWSIIDFLFVKI
jgi:hypothetical protein